MLVSIGECGPTDAADDIGTLVDIGAAPTGGGGIDDEDDIVEAINDEGGGGGGGGDGKINGGADEPTRVNDTDEEDCDSCDKAE